MTNMMTNIMTNIMTNMMTSMMTSMMTNMMTNTISYDDRNEIESLFSFMSLMSSLDALSRRANVDQEIDADLVKRPPFRNAPQPL